MNINRMNERGVKFNQMIPAILHNYELKFNKVSKKQGAVANVMYKHGSIVEGVIYNVGNLTQMDKFEGYPKHYDRLLMKVMTKEMFVIDAWVYVAKPQHIQEGLKPTQEYLNNLLAGKEFLSDEYYKKLEMING